MSKFPSLPLFTDAWVADTKHLSRLERGTYHDLLVLMWRSPHCRVPNDDAWLGKRLGMTASEVASELRPLIAEFCANDGNWITQKRLQREWHWCADNSKKRSDAAKSRWRNKKDESKCSTPVECTSNAPILSYPNIEEEREVDARARDPGPLISPEAVRLADDYRRVAGVDDDEPAWFGLPYSAHVWLSRGYQRESILAIGARLPRGKGLRYHDAAVTRELDNPPPAGPPPNGRVISMPEMSRKERIRDENDRALAKLREFARHADDGAAGGDICEPAGGLLSGPGLRQS